MRAVRMHAYGDPGVVSVDQVPEPRLPYGDELLVQVAASSINGTDLGLRAGRMRVATWGRLPVTLGFDLVGEVVACGPRVTAFSPGDHVAALLGHDGGAQADLVRVRQHRAARVPDGVPDEAAATVPLAGLTALQALFAVGGLGGRRVGANVLIIGASGGIGSFAVQLAVLRGARVTGVAAGSKLDRVRSWGAETVIDRHLTEVTQLGARWDLVVDAHGGSNYADLRQLLLEGGMVVSSRPVSPDMWRAPAAALRRRHTRSYGAVMTRPHSQDLAHLLRLVECGDITAPADRAFPVTSAHDAYTHAESAAGKVILRFS